MNNKMTSRERVLAAINGKPVDRLPVMTWLNPHTTCRLIADLRPPPAPLPRMMGRAIWRRFTRRGGMNAGAFTRILPMAMEEYGNSRYALELGSDIVILSPDFISPSSFIRHLRFSDGNISVPGPFGGTMTFAGVYMHPAEPAVKDVADLRVYQFPLVTDRHFKAVRAFRTQYPDICLLVETGAMQSLLCDFILSTESFMLALHDCPGEIMRFMKRLCIWLENIIHLAANAGADVIFLQDDYGANHRPLISMDMWKKITLPCLARLVETAHSDGLPLMLHSCGFQMPFLKHYVDAGVDALQSLQVGAGNDLRQAYALTGGKLAFATGIDVQRAESMTPGEMERSITEACALGKKNGRFILAMSHMLQHTLPKESYEIIFNQIKEQF
jgi:uroporphyrinogen-III decarboxylase